MALQCDDLNKGTWNPITLFLKTKASQVFCKRTSNIHEFESSFLGGQVISNGFKVFNG